jgi:FkbM family methyltransferase
MKTANTNTTSALAELFRRHSAVADALVTSDSPGAESIAWIVPDRNGAGMLHRSAHMDAAERLGPLEWHEPAAGLRVAGLNRRETDFLYREIFSDGAYLRRGITLPPDAVVLDVGANIGMFALRAAFDSPGARVIAVEPVPELAEAIRINAELHGVDVTVRHAAVGDTEGETDFTFYPRNSVMSGRFADTAEDVAVLRGYLLADPSATETARLDRVVADRLHGEMRRVPLTTVAALAADHRLEHIDLMKVDVEKSEMEVLRGVGEALWSRVDQVVVEVHDVDGRLGDVVALLERLGFLVEFDQDPRLVRTPCWSVYARRSSVRHAVPSARRHAAPDAGPTLRELTHDLRRMAGADVPAGPHPDRFVVVPELPAGDPAKRTAPRSSWPGETQAAATVVEAWTALFGAEAVRPEADFFELGGTSMLALRLLDHVEKTLGEGLLTPELIFATGTLGALVTAVEASE